MNVIELLLSIALSVLITSLFTGALLLMHQRQQAINTRIALMEKIRAVKFLLQHAANQATFNGCARQMRHGVSVLTAGIYQLSPRAMSEQSLVSLNWWDDPHVAHIVGQQSRDAVAFSTCLRLSYNRNCK